MNNFNLERVFTLLGSYFFPNFFIYDKNISDKLKLLKFQTRLGFIASCLICFGILFIDNVESSFLLLMFVVIVGTSTIVQMYKNTKKMNKACEYVFTTFLQPQNSDWFERFLVKKNLLPQQIIGNHLFVPNAISQTILYVDFIKSVEVLWFAKEILSPNDFQEFVHKMENADNQLNGKYWLQSKIYKQWFYVFIEVVKNKHFYYDMTKFNEKFQEIFNHEIWLSDMNVMISNSIIGERDKTAACTNCYARLKPHMIENDLQWCVCPICQQTKDVESIEKLVGILAENKNILANQRNIWNDDSSEVKFYPLEKIIIRYLKEPDRAVAKMMEVYDSYNYPLEIEIDTSVKLSINSERMLLDWLQAKSNSKHEKSF